MTQGHLWSPEKKRSKDCRCLSRSSCFKEIMPYPQIHQWYHGNSSHSKRVKIANLPRMTPRFRYQQAIRIGFPVGSGVLTFSREDFQTALSGRLLDDREEGLHPFDAALPQWVADVDTGSAEPCLLPVGWPGIENVLLKLIESRKDPAFCVECSRDHGSSDVGCDDFPETFGSSMSGYGRVRCPKGHVLFQTDSMHAILNRPRPEK